MRSSILVSIFELFRYTFYTYNLSETEWLDIKVSILWQYQGAYLVASLLTWDLDTARTVTPLCTTGVGLTKICQFWTMNFGVVPFGSATLEILWQIGVWIRPCFAVNPSYLFLFFFYSLPPLHFKSMSWFSGVFQFFVINHFSDLLTTFMWCVNFFYIRITATLCERNRDSGLNFNTIIIISI